MTDLTQKYYLGGYFLTRLIPLNFGTYSEATIHTCSKCINDHLVNIWSYSWTIDNDEQAEEAKENFQLSNREIDLIRAWIDKNHNQHKLGWVNVFTDLETALEYKTTFFSHLHDIKVFALYFNERERADLLDEHNGCEPVPWFVAKTKLVVGV